jgi:hypothetical protein
MATKSINSLIIDACQKYINGDTSVFNAETSAGIQVNNSDGDHVLTLAADGSAIELAEFSASLASILSFTPTDTSRFDQRAYKDIIRKGEPSRSYYTEAASATRGSRKEMPLQGIVAWNASNVAIIDTEFGEPTLWMVFEAGRDPFSAQWTTPHNMIASGDYPITDAGLAKGVLYASTNRASGSSATFFTGLVLVDFLGDKSSAVSVTSAVADEGGQQVWPGNIAERNTLLAHYKIADEGLVNSQVNSVAISQPFNHYPLDQYGRPAFAIACVTDGGVSVILPDADNRGKRVTDSADTTGLNGTVWWVGEYLYHGRIDDVRRSALVTIEAGDGWTGYNEGFGLRDASGLVLVPHPPGADVIASDAGAQNGVGSVAKLCDGAVGLGVVFEQSDAFGSLSAFLSSTALSGWCPQGRSTASKPVLAPDFNAYAAGSVAAATPLNDDFTSYADQAAAEAAGYTFNTATFDAANDQIDFGGGSESIRFEGAMSLTDGDIYVLEVTTSGRTTGAAFIQQNFSGMPGAPTITADGTYTASFTHTAGHAYIVTTSDWDGSIDSITIRRAYPDLSPANNGAIINGTLTAAAVETGADLFALSGWSASDYLEAPYSSDLQFGTGDWVVSAFFKTTNASGSDHIFSIRDSGGSNGFFNIYVNSSGVPTFDVSDDGGATLDRTQGSTAFNDGSWHAISVLRRGSVFELWVDCELQVTKAVTNAAGSLTITGAGCSIGVQSNGPGANNGGAFDAGSLSLPRVTKGYAPTPDQIRRMYEDEKKLFEADAKCFLPSDTVNDIDARDGLLAIGTEGGAVIHDGFKRLELLDSGDIGLTENGVDSVALLGGNDIAAVTGTEGVARLASRNLAEAQVVDAYSYERDFAGKGYTTDATPLDIAKLPLAEGELIEWRGSITARSDDGTERASYTRVVRAYRDVNGNATLAGADTLGTDDETTAGMDVAFAADTTAQTIDLQVTGVASTNIQWSYSGTLTVNKQ